MKVKIRNTSSNYTELFGIIESMEARAFYIYAIAACETCHDVCNHTTDISHAFNFEKGPDGVPLGKKEGGIK